MISLWKERVAVLDYPSQIPCLVKFHLLSYCLRCSRLIRLNESISQMSYTNQGFQIALRGGGCKFLMEIFSGKESFLPGKGNLRRSDFDDSNLFES